MPARVGQAVTDYFGCRKIPRGCRRETYRAGDSQETPRAPRAGKPLPFWESKGYELFAHLDVDVLRTFLASWPFSPLSARRVLRFSDGCHAHTRHGVSAGRRRPSALRPSEPLTLHRTAYSGTSSHLVPELQFPANMLFGAHTLIALTTILGISAATAGILKVRHGEGRLTLAFGLSLLVWCAVLGGVA